MSSLHHITEPAYLSTGQPFWLFYQFAGKCASRAGWLPALCLGTFKNQPVHSPPATSRGPFFFFSSCNASVNSFPPFFSRAEPESVDKTAINENKNIWAADREQKARQQVLVQTSRKDMRMEGQTGGKADTQQSCQSFQMASLSYPRLLRDSESKVFSKTQGCYLFQWPVPSL